MGHMTSDIERKTGDGNPSQTADRNTSNVVTPEPEMSWDEFERFIADYEKEQLRKFYARIGPEKARLLGSTQVTGYKTPSSNYRWGTRQKRRN